MIRKLWTVGSVAGLAAAGMFGGASAASAHQENAPHAAHVYGADRPDGSWYTHQALFKAPSGQMSPQVSALVADYQEQAKQAQAAWASLQSAFAAWKTAQGDAREAARELAAGQGSEQEGALRTAYEAKAADAAKAHEALQAARQAWLAEFAQARGAAKVAWMAWVDERKATQEPKSEDGQGENTNDSQGGDSQGEDKAEDKDEDSPVAKDDDGKEDGAQSQEVAYRAGSDGAWTRHQKARDGDRDRGEQREHRDGDRDRTGHREHHDGARHHDGDRHSDGDRERAGHR